MTKINALVTGGSGYFGSILIKKLLDNNIQTFSIDINQPKDHVEKIKFFKIDITNSKEVSDFFQNNKIDVIFHNVAQVPLAKNKQKFNSVNILGTKNISQYGKNNGVKHLIYTSSSAVYGVPKNNPVTENTKPIPSEEYGLAKLEGEKICQDLSDNNFKVTIIRPRTILGHGRMGIFSILFDWIESNKRIPLFNNGSNLYQFVHASDLADAILLSMNQKYNFEIYNIGASDVLTMRENLEKLVKLVNSKTTFYSVPLKQTEFLLNLLSFLNLIPLGKYHTLMYGRSLFFDNTKAKKDLKFYPKYRTTEMFLESYKDFINNKNKHKSKNLSLHQKKLLNYY